MKKFGKKYKSRLILMINLKQQYIKKITIIMI